MSTSAVAKGVEAIRELGSPQAPAPKTGIPLGTLMINFGAQAAENAYRDYLNSSAQQYSNDIDVIAATAKSPEEFITRVDSEVTPKYKYDILTKYSLQHRAITEGIPAKAGMIGAREQNNVRNAASNVLMSRLVELRNRAPSYDKYEAMANDLFKEHQEQYGAPDGAQVIAFNEEKRRAKQSYVDGQQRALVAENAEQLTNAFVRSGEFNSAQSAIDFIKEPLMNAIYNPDNPSWIDLAKGSLELVMQNVPNKEMGNEILNDPDISQWLSKQDRTHLEAMAIQSESNNNINLVQESDRVSNMTREFLNSGRRYPGVLPNPELEAQNQFNTSHDLLHMSDDSLLNLAIDNPQYTWPVIDARRKAFATDPIKAAKHYFNESIEPLVAPIVTEDVMINERELMNSIAGRVFKFNGMRSKYGNDETINNYFTDEEVSSINNAIAKLSINKQQDLTIRMHKLLTDNKHPNPIETIGRLTNSASLRALARFTSEQPYAKERYPQIKRAAAAYANLEENEPKTLGVLQGYFSRYVQEAKSASGIKIIASGLSGTLKEDAGVWVIGQSIGVANYQEFEKMAADKMIFRSRDEVLREDIFRVFAPLKAPPPFKGKGFFEGLQTAVSGLKYALTERLPGEDLGITAEEHAFADQSLLDYAMQAAKYKVTQYGTTFLSQEDRKAFEDIASNTSIVFVGAKAPRGPHGRLEPEALLSTNTFTLSDLERRGAIVYTDISFTEKGVSFVDSTGALYPVIDSDTGEQITVSAISPFTKMAKGMPLLEAQTKHTIHVVEGAMDIEEIKTLVEARSTYQEARLIESENRSKAIRETAAAVKAKAAKLRGNK